MLLMHDLEGEFTAGWTIVLPACSIADQRFGNSNTLTPLRPFSAIFFSALAVRTGYPDIGPRIAIAFQVVVATIAMLDI